MRAKRVFFFYSGNEFEFESPPSYATAISIIYRDREASSTLRSPTYGYFLQAQLILSAWVLWLKSFLFFISLTNV